MSRRGREKWVKSEWKHMILNGFLHNFLQHGQKGKPVVKPVLCNNTLSKPILYSFGSAGQVWKTMESQQRHKTMENLMCTIFFTGILFGVTVGRRMWPRAGDYGLYIMDCISISRVTICVIYEDMESARIYSYAVSGCQWHFWYPSKDCTACCFGKVLVGRVLLVLPGQFLPN